MIFGWYKNFNLNNIWIEEEIFLLSINQAEEQKIHVDIIYYLPTAKEMRKTFVTVLVFLSAVAIVIKVTALPIPPTDIHKAYINIIQRSSGTCSNVIEMIFAKYFKLNFVILFFILNSK